MGNFHYYLIEFLDELVFGVTGAAWPAIQTSLGLNYTQIGILLTLPNMVSTILEPFLGVLGDIWNRRLLILGGGVFFVLALMLTGIGSSFFLLLLAFCIFYPASGAYVSLSQASLMDVDTDRHDHNMARWTFSGSLGVTLGPILLVGFSSLGFGWRGVFISMGFLAVVALVYTWKRLPSEAVVHPTLPAWSGIIDGFHSALRALRRREVVRWLVLLEFSDLMLDVLLGFLALYFHDVAGLSESQAAGAVLVWLIAGLAGDLLLIPLLEKVDGIKYLRWSVLLELILFPAFLLSPWIGLKFILAGLLGLFNSGWYAILKGRLYSSLPGQSASVMTLGNLTGLVGGCLPLLIGLAADTYGLKIAIWLLLAGPLALLIGLPVSKKKPVH